MSERTGSLGTFLRRERKAHELLMNPYEKGPAFLFSLLRHQRSYLIWTLYLVFFQVLEVFCLASTHYVYFPPESLVFLRLLSTGSVFSILFAVIVRISLKTQGGEHDRTVHWIRVGARFIFWLGLAISYLILLWVLLKTRLHLSSPPIYRALLLSGLVAFPMDCVSTFLLYNSRTLGSQGLPVRYRVLSYFSLFASLIFLVANWPGLFLLAKILPRFFFFRRLWSAAFRGPFFESLAPSRGNFRLLAGRLVSIGLSRWMFLALPIAFELTFYRVFSVFSAVVP